MCMSRRLSAAMIALVAMFVVGAAQAQVLDQVPADAWVVIKVNNLQKTSGKMAGFVKQINMAQMMQAAVGNADPLTAIQAKMNIKQGLDLGGDMAFVILNSMGGAGGPGGAAGEAGAPGGGGEPPMIILLPVTDYKLFLGNFPDAKTEGDVTSVSIEDEDSFVASWGKFAVIAPSKAVLAKKPAGLKLQGVAARQMTAGCAGVYVNMPAIRTVAVPMLQQARVKIVRDMERELQKNPKFAPLAKVALNQVLDVAEGFLQTADSVTESIDIRPEGIAITGMVEFAPNSYMAKQLAGVKGTDGPLLAGLPTQNYLLYGGGISSPVLGTMLNDFLSPIVKELQAMGPEMKPALNYIDAMNKAQAAQKSSVFGLVAPTAALGQGSLIQVLAITEGDAATLKGAMKGMAEAQADVMKMVFAGQPGVPADAMTVKYTPNAKQVGGVQFDEMANDFNMPGNDPGAMQAKQMMAMLYGPDGQKTYLGAVDAKHVLVVLGLDDKTIADAVAAAKGGKDVLTGTPTLKAVDAQLPKSRCGVIYVPIGQWVNTGLLYAKQAGFPVNLQPLPEMSPVGLAVGTEGAAMRMDAFVPSDLVQSLVAAGMQMQQMMMQPHGRGVQPGMDGGMPPGGIAPDGQ